MIKSMYIESARESNNKDISRMFLDSQLLMHDPFEGIFPVEDPIDEVEEITAKPVVEETDAKSDDVVEEKISEPPVFDSQETFVNYFLPLYEKALAERKIPTEYAKYLVGQIALESGWGKRPAGWREKVVSNNYMGEKLLPGSTEKGVEIITHEEDKDGNRYQTTATFRIFNSVQDMVNFHVRKFTQGRWAKANVFDPNNISGFATRVHNAGYATGTSYAEDLNKWIGYVQSIIDKSKPDASKGVSSARSSQKPAYQEVIDKAKEFGINFIVASTLRPSARTKSGNVSRHARGQAVDVCAVDGDYNKLWQQMKNSGFKAWLESKGFRILREDIPWVRWLTGSKSSHFHIGMDSTIDTDGLFIRYKKDPRT